MTDLTGLSDLVAGDVLEPLEGTLIREYEAEATITKGQVVYLSSDEKVSPATSAQNCIGIAVKDASSGEICPRAQSKLKQATQSAEAKQFTVETHLHESYHLQTKQLMREAARRTLSITAEPSLTLNNQQQLLET